MGNTLKTLFKSGKNAYSDSEIQGATNSLYQNIYEDKEMSQYLKGLDTITKGIDFTRRISSTI